MRRLAWFGAVVLLLAAFPSFYWLLGVTAGLEMIHGVSATLRGDTKRTWSFGNPWEEIHLFPVVITAGVMVRWGGAS